MFQVNPPRSKLQSALKLLELVFHTAARNVRKAHGNAVMGILINIGQMVLMLVIIWLLFAIIGKGGSPIRGDFIIYILSGVALFMTHVKTVSAVQGASAPTSPMLLHAPMSTMVAVAAAALSSLYTQAVSLAVILFFYHAIVAPVTIDEPVGAFLMVLLAWATGIGIGMILQSIMPWAPDLFGMISTIYRRASIIASGKMFLANTMPSSMLPWFDWNPLFHAIDQGRGFIFLNYVPHNTSVTYPLKGAAVVLIIGLMAEYYTRRHVSVSWSAGK